MRDEDAHAVVDRIADDLESCASNLQQKGALVDGAARIVAIAAPNGTPALSVRLAPGDAVAQNALVCIIAPVRATTFASATSGTPGFAIEATWGPTRQPSTATGSGL
jgi:hypothetical protein